MYASWRLSCFRKEVVVWLSRLTERPPTDRSNGLVTFIHTSADCRNYLHLKTPARLMDSEATIRDTLCNSVVLL
jgi:hypothetical protein